jgi:hypothetical protein
MEARMTTTRATRFGIGIAMFVLASAGSLHAQMEIGTWVRQDSTSKAGIITMDVEACCNGGRRLTYHVLMGQTTALLTVDSPFDGTEAPVLVNGKPIGETMAIKRIDARHASTIAKLNGAPLGTSEATLSADGKILTVLNDFSSSAGGQQAGKSTEIWVKK